MGNTILVANAKFGTAPDVAFSHGDNLNVRIAYADTSTWDVVVMHEEFGNIMSAMGAMAFTVDDVNPNVYPLGVSELHANQLQLDSPDHYPEENWSYVYSTDSKHVKARIQNHSLSPSAFTVSLTGTWLLDYNNRFLTIAYDPTGTSIHYGWNTEYTSGGPRPDYVAVEINHDGTFITPPDTFKRVTNPAACEIQFPIMAFSKQNDASDHLFVVYPMCSGTMPFLSFDMRYKLVPWGSASFSPLDTENLGIDGPAADGNIAVTALPNPFGETFSLGMTGDATGEIYRVTLTDLQGKICAQLRGNISTLNAELGGATQKMAPGMYLVTVHGNRFHKTLRVVKTQ